MTIENDHRQFNDNHRPAIGELFVPVGYVVPDGEREQYETLPFESSRSKVRTIVVSAVGGAAIGYGTAKMQEAFNGEDISTVGEALYSTVGAGFAGGLAVACVSFIVTGRRSPQDS